MPYIQYVENIHYIQYVQYEHYIRVYFMQYAQHNLLYINSVSLLLSNEFIYTQVLDIRHEDTPVSLRGNPQVL